MRDNTGGGDEGRLTELVTSRSRAQAVVAARIPAASGDGAAEEVSLHLR